MLPHSSAFANSKSAEILKFVDIPTRDRQFAKTFACLKRILGRLHAASQQHLPPDIATCAKAGRLCLRSPVVVEDRSIAGRAAAQYLLSLKQQAAMSMPPKLRH